MELVIQSSKSSDLLLWDADPLRSDLEDFFASKDYGLSVRTVVIRLEENDSEAAIQESRARCAEGGITTIAELHLDLNWLIIEALSAEEGYGYIVHKIVSDLIGFFEEGEMPGFNGEQFVDDLYALIWTEEVRSSFGGGSAV